MKSSRLFFALPADSGSFRARNDFVARCYDKVALACQAITALKAVQGSQARAGRGSVSLFQGRHRAPHSARNLHKNTQFLSKPGKRAANLQRIIGHGKNHQHLSPIAASRRWRNVLRLKSESGATRMTLLQEKQVTGRTSCVLCGILPWLAVLSIVPAFLLLVACKFSHQCWLHGFMWGMALPGLPRTLAIAMALGPFLFLLTYAFAFLNCRRPRGVPDRGGRSFG
jgi:hypothetical protein